MRGMVIAPIDMLRLASYAAALTFVMPAPDVARAQSSLPSNRPATGDPRSAGAMLPGDPVAFCADLKRVTLLALTRERFSTITGSAREGSFFDTTLPLSGWKDCSLYGSRTYTCDSHDLASADQAVERQSATVADIKSCLGAGWTEDHERASPTYVVVRSSRARYQ
jgi:hypothetical protein